MTSNDLAERNRKIVADTFAEFAAGNIDVLRTVLRNDFVEHSPGNPSGREAFIEFIAAAPVAGARLDLKRIITDDRYAVVHYQMVPPGDVRGLAVVDIWRLEDGRIVEHWDVVQPVPEDSQIPNGMF